ncbi:uncharacterized protein LOC142351869 isoform X2 [Convolutriloba macropyga]|uniref:uncharacterized protein LOC142351869 isoform X2 n=1 Tax=Convolutriloba macropyga TaxID=536237 RepID=UPI003F51DEE5
MAMRSNPTLFLITCKGCREVFDNSRKPFSLNCSPGHRLCEKCLDDYTRKFCPQCRKPILNRGGLRVDKPTLERAMKAKAAEFSVGGGTGNSTENLFTSSLTSDHSFSACQRCKNPADTYKMVCPHCSQLVCQKCASQDLNDYVPQLQMAFSRYLDLLKSVNEEVDKHIRAEQIKIDKFFEERKREAKNQLMTSVATLNLSKKREEAENLLTEINRMAMDDVFEADTSSSISLENDFQTLCNLVLRAEKVRKSQVMEPDIDFSEAVVHMEHFQEKVQNRSERFCKRPISFSLGSGLDQVEKRVFDQLFAPAPQLSQTRKFRHSSSHNLEQDAYGSRPLGSRFSSRSSTLTATSNPSLRRNSSFQNLIGTPLRPRKPSLGFNKI